GEGLLRVTVTMPRADERYVAAGGVRFHVWRADPARKRRTTPVLLLHGLPETALAWRDLLPALAVDRTVIAPDLKGLGASEVRPPYDSQTLAAELAALLLHEVDGEVDVVGHDWGGSLALTLAGQRPELVRRLVVINAPFRHLNLLRAAHVPLLSLPALPEIAFRLAGDQLVRGAFRLGWKSGVAPADVVAAYVDAYTSADRVAAMLSYYRSATRPRLVRFARLAARGGDRVVPPPRVRVDRSLVVWGAADPVLPLSVGESVVRDLGAGSTMVTLPGVGHFVPEEAPDIVAATVGDFLRAS
ncbi:MAG: alpha/beta fold hydrolase, partial [Mycobacteriales bacterium]